MTFRPNKKSQHEESPALARANFLFEHVALALMTAFACIGGIIWMVAIATDYWVITISSSSQYLSQDEDTSHTNFDIFLWSYAGLWKRCDIFYEASLNSTPPLNNMTVSNSDYHKTVCNFHLLSTSKSNDTSSGMAKENTQPEDFIRAEMSVVILVIIIMTLALGFSVYALRYPRYMYKRVAAALHAFTAVTLFIIIELVKSGEHPGRHIENINSPGHEQEVIVNTTILVNNYHGYSFLLAWTALLVFVSTAISFICMSGKRKNLLQDSDIVLK